jgi:hypothetical protein
MAQQVYSTRFVKTALTGTNTTYYTVPQGNVAVVRTMTMAWVSLARAGGVGQVLLNGANSFVWIVAIAASTADSAHWEGNMVMPAGELLRAAATATGTIFLTVSGFLLSVP